MSKTQLTPKQLFETRNTTDVFDRAILVGLLKVFNRRLFYEQRWDDTEDGGLEALQHFAGLLGHKLTLDDVRGLINET